MIYAGASLKNVGVYAGEVVVQEYAGVFSYAGASEGNEQSESPAGRNRWKTC